MIAFVAIISHWLALLDTLSFLWVMAVVAALALISLFLALRGLFTLWRDAAIGGRNSAKALMFSALILLPFLLCVVRWYQLPHLHQVSTDLINPPVLTRNNTNPQLLENPFEPITLRDAEIQIDRYPDIVSHRYTAPVEQIVAAIDEVLAWRGWRVVSRVDQGTPESPLTLMVSARFPIIALPSDIAIRIEPVDDENFVDMRSASRYGSHDLGANAWLVRSFLVELDEVLALAPVQ